MTRLPESSQWEDDIELISRSERVSGGLDGVANRPLKKLANRTRYLKDQAEKSYTSIAEKVSAVKTFDEGATLESVREEIMYGAYRLVWTGVFPKTVPVGSSPESTGGIGAGRWAYTSDAPIRRDLSSNDPKYGCVMTALPYSGTVADALQYIYVGALGKFNNREDGCTGAILERQSLLGAPATSIFVEGKEYYGVVEFPNGTFALEDLQLKSGWLYKLNPFTRIVPHRNAEFAFTTVGTKGVVPGDPTWDRLMYCEISGGVIGDFWKETGD
ncbi:TPA: hypothetical protein NPO21_005471, partial [Klebsiella variicola subsp. variicola]|nr:hypothetical protein [Klebsiella variicola subsp. variicola]